MYTVYGDLPIPSNLIRAELDGLYGSSVLQDMGEIIKLYEVYEHGADFNPENTKDYVPAELHYKIIRGIIDKEARWLFSKAPDITVNVDLGETKAARKRSKEISTKYQDLVDTVLTENRFKEKLLKAARDCFIGKRVALIVNFNKDSGIQLSFIPSLEFVYDVDPSNSDKLTKLIAFYGLNDAKAKSDQRIYKKKYWVENELCYYSESVYDGLGREVEVITEPTNTGLPYIPAWVIINDGLSGDLLGVSEVSMLKDYESWYSKLASSDIDGQRSGMHPIRYTVDASPESTSGLTIAPNAFWDLASDQNAASDRTAQVGTLETSMGYSAALSVTLDRQKNTMYEQTAVPNVSPEALKGVVTSGKTLKAIYWDLIVRCDEKMLAWRPAIQGAVRAIIEGYKYYPEIYSRYLEEALPEESFDIKVENQYPIPEDEAEEKNNDLAEVNAQTMSKKAYMKKWRGLTDEDADEELRQIALEKQLLEDSASLPEGIEPDATENPPEENQPENPPEEETPPEEAPTEEPTEEPTVEE